MYFSDFQIRHWVGGAATQTFAPGGKYPCAATGRMIGAYRLLALLGCWETSICPGQQILMIRVRVLAAETNRLITCLMFIRPCTKKSYNNHSLQTSLEMNG